MKSELANAPVEVKRSFNEVLKHFSGKYTLERAIKDYTAELSAAKSWKAKGVKFVDAVEELVEFVEEHSDEIRKQLVGESDGWNQKMTAFNEILAEENVEVAEGLEESEEFENAINNI